MTETTTTRDAALRRGLEELLTETQNLAFRCGRQAREFEGWAPRSSSTATGYSLAYHQTADRIRALLAATREGNGR